MPKYVICCRLFWEAYSDVLKGLDFIKTFICFDDIDAIKLTIATMASRHVDVTTFEPADVRGETDTAMVVFSSGTTGMSKGVQLTHLNCIVHVVICGYMQSESMQTCFVGGVLRSMHTICLIFCLLSMGKRVVYTESIPEPTLFKTLHKYQVNIMFLLPVIIKYMINAEIADDCDLLSLKIVYSVGDHLHPTVIESFKQRFPHVRVLQMYGGSEFGPTALHKPSDIETASTATHTGVVTPGVTFKVVDVETRATLGPNQRGEICVRSARLMKGYLGATSPYLDDQGFFLTGDLGYFDEYKQLYLVNRLKDVICIGGFKCFLGFGGSEFGPTALHKPSDIETASTATHTGVVTPGVTFKVVDVETRATLGPNQRGEICVRSARLMKGYLGATSPYLDDQGFFLTGDLGYFDEYKQLYLVNRLKDVICIGGFKASPMDIETVLLTHPAVREAVVVGKPVYDLGEVPAAFVVLQPGAQVTETELVDYVAKEVSELMQLRGGVRFVPEIPKSSSRKILRRRLKEMLELEEPCETLNSIQLNSIRLFRK